MPGRCKTRLRIEQHDILPASGLIYCRGENPHRPTWTPEEGGRGPYMTDGDAQVFDSLKKAPLFARLEGPAAVAASRFCSDIADVNDTTVIRLPDQFSRRL